jgi:hypothetical protein
MQPTVALRELKDVAADAGPKINQRMTPGNMLSYFFLGVNFGELRPRCGLNSSGPATHETGAKQFRQPIEFQIRLKQNFDDCFYESLRACLSVLNY